jgi:hypothetical protein
MPISILPILIRVESCGREKPLRGECTWNRHRFRLYLEVWFTTLVISGKQVYSGGQWRKVVFRNVLCITACFRSVNGSDSVALKEDITRQAAPNERRVIKVGWSTDLYLPTYTQMAVTLIDSLLFQSYEYGYLYLESIVGDFRILETSIPEVQVHHSLSRAQGVCILSNFQLMAVIGYVDVFRDFDGNVSSIRRNLKIPIVIRLHDYLCYC